MEENIISVSSSEILIFIEQQRYEEAIQTLKNIIQANPTSENFAMLGLAHFHSEQYEESATCYEKALQLEPSNNQWQEMLQHSRGNLFSEVNVPVPEIYHFDKNKLLAGPIALKGKLPPDPPPAPSPGLFKKSRLLLGNASGALLTFS